MTGTRSNQEVQHDQNITVYCILPVCDYLLQHTVDTVYRPRIPQASGTGGHIPEAVRSGVDTMPFPGIL